MKRLILLTCFLFSTLAMAQAYESGNPALREEMQSLRGSYIELENSLAGKQPDYDSLKWELERMEGTVRRIQSGNRNAKLDRPLKDMLSDIRSLQGNVKQRNDSGIENGMTGLYENCFRCHLTHTVHKKPEPQ